MDQWVGSYQISKNLVTNCDLIKIMQFCLKIYDLWKHATHGGWMGRLLCGSGCGVMSNH